MLSHGNESWPTGSSAANIEATDATKSTETVWMVSKRVVCSLCWLFLALSITRFFPSAWTIIKRSMGRHWPTPNRSSTSSLVMKGEQKCFCCSSWVTSRMSSWNRGGPLWVILVMASSAAVPSHVARSGGVSGVTVRKTPLCESWPTMGNPRPRTISWPNTMSGHRKRMAITAQKPGRLSAATNRELSHLCPSSHCSKGLTAWATACKIRRCSAALAIRQRCHFTMYSTTNWTSASGQGLGAKGDGNCWAAWMWLVIPSPGGSKWSKPLELDEGYRCPESPA